MYGKFEYVKVGNIDREFRDKIDENSLKNIIYEIKDRFNSQLGYSVFDYSNSGKPIDIVYMPPSQKKKRLQRAIKELESEKIKIENSELKLKNNKELLNIENNELNRHREIVNEKVKQYNEYISSINNKKYTKDEYYKVKKEASEKEQIIKRVSKEFDIEKRRYNQSVREYNRQLSRYRTMINRYNQKIREIEVLSKSIKEVKGIAKGYTKEITEKKYTNGKEVSRKTERTSYMEKIEIYGFDTLAELRAILAHELCHLVGVGHIESNGALMNPMLQKNQVKELYLSQDDIREIDKIFK
jgi:D-ribose pyranose/furanose isomerase RbsD